MKDKIPCVYILANQKKGTLYVGVTTDLVKRVHEHKSNLVDGFTKRNSIHNLVYFETVETILTAIEREKQIKAGSRGKKLELIESVNPEWNDLYDKIL